MKDKRLKPCPLCGTQASIQDKQCHYNVSCGVADDDSDSCGLVLFGDGKSTKRWMIHLWNRREAIANGEIIAASDYTQEMQSE